MTCTACKMSDRDWKKADRPPCECRPTFRSVSPGSVFHFAPGSAAYVKIDRLRYRLANLPHMTYRIGDPDRSVSL